MRLFFVLLIGVFIAGCAPQYNPPPDINVDVDVPDQRNRDHQRPNVIVVPHQRPNVIVVPPQHRHGPDIHVQPHHGPDIHVQPAPPRRGGPDVRIHGDIRID